MKRICLNQWNLENSSFNRNINFNSIQISLKFKEFLEAIFTSFKLTGFTPLHTHTKHSHTFLQNISRLLISVMNKICTNKAES